MKNDLLGSVLKVSGLTKRYGDLTAVSNLNLSVEAGEVFGLLGHNGAGKSTTIECILGIKKVDGGEVSLLGMDPTKHRKKVFEQVGVQLQESNYQNKIKVKEICETMQSIYSDPMDYQKLLKEFGLEDKKHSFVEELSGGQKQRLSVLLALLPDPKIVFLDELTSGLDSKARRGIWSYLKGLNERGVTIFLTSHYMDEVEYLCDRICILSKGAVVITDTPQNIINKSGKGNLEEAYLFFTGEEEREHAVV